MSNKQYCRRCQTRKTFKVPLPDGGWQTVMRGAADEEKGLVPLGSGTQGEALYDYTIII